MSVLVVGEVAAVPVEVGAADAGVDDLDADFVFAWRAFVGVQEVEGSVGGPGGSAHWPVLRSWGVCGVGRLAGWRS